MKERVTLAFRRLIVRLSVSPFRLVAFLLHVTRLELIYKPRFIRHSALIDLTEEVVSRLPKYCHSMTGAQSEPMNIIFIGTELDLKLAFKAAGWHRANPASPIHVLHGLISAVLRRPYHTGPFMPLYVNIGLQDLAYQRATKGNDFRRRHHIRIWRTGIILPGHKPVWVGSASYDAKMKVILMPPFIVHHVDANLDKERAFVVRTLENQGAAVLKTVTMIDQVLASCPHENAYGSSYFTDGRAVVVEV